MTNTTNSDTVVSFEQYRNRIQKKLERVPADERDGFEILYPTIIAFAKLAYMEFCPEHRDAAKPLRTALRNVVLSVGPMAPFIIINYEMAKLLDSIEEWRAIDTMKREAVKAIEEACPP